MEHMLKSTQSVGGCISLFSKSTHGTFFVTKKKEGVPQAIFEKYHGTFLVIIMLKFVSNIRYTVKNQ